MLILFDLTKKSSPKTEKQKTDNKIEKTEDPKKNTNRKLLSSPYCREPKTRYPSFPLYRSLITDCLFSGHRLSVLRSSIFCPSVFEFLSSDTRLFAPISRPSIKSQFNPSLWISDSRKFEIRFTVFLARQTERNGWHNRFLVLFPSSVPLSALSLRLVSSEYRNSAHSHLLLGNEKGPSPIFNIAGSSIY